MKKTFQSLAFILMLSSPISAEEFNEFNIGYSNWDLDGFNSINSYDIGFNIQSERTRFSAEYWRLDGDGDDAGIWHTGIDYGFGNWADGTAYFGIGYLDSELADTGEVSYTIGYAKSSTEGMNYDVNLFNVDGETDVRIDLSWDIGNANYLGLGYWSSDGLDIISLNYSKKF